MRDTGSGAFFFVGTDRFHRNDVGVVSTVDGVPCLATDAHKIRSTAVRPLRDFFLNRGDLNAIRPWSAAASEGRRSADWFADNFRVW